ncbi:MAG: toll/interleukin-1 receptor domain-containing protein [Candidatus Solibacter sp.]
MPKCCDACQQVARIVARGVAAGKTVEIDGLGVFYPDARRGFRFVPRALPQVFIAYGREDEVLASRLYEDLNRAGFSPWMDVRKLLAGQNWPRAIEAAIESSDFFVACFSGNSVRKKGGFQSELRYALDCARQVPLDEIYIVPLRLDECPVPRTIQHELQYIDLFPDWDSGIERLLTMLRREVERRRPAAPLPAG